MKKTNIKSLENDLFSQVDYEETPPDDIVSYNELRSASDLFRMHEKGILEINPDYQRQIVWKNPEQTRFIDSLIKQLPIPSMCFSLDYKTQTWQVIDGLQRLFTIIKFLSDDDWELSNISDINSSIRGKKVSYIRETHPDLFSRVENITLPITILRCDLNKKDHAEYIFMIFHRLNTGGIKLNNQEIRNAIYQGSFNDFLKNCNENQIWGKIFGEKEVLRDRFKKIELILRFFAFFDEYLSYNGKLSYFLNSYMHKNRDIKNFDNKKKLFESVVDVLYNKVDINSFQDKKSNVILESAMFGIAINIGKVKSAEAKKVKDCYKKMIDDDLFSTANISEGILKKDKVLKRLGLAKKIFANL